jgi:hypothetical protein
MFLVDAEDGQIALCLDCKVKLQALQNQNVENMERMLNHLAGQIEMASGVSGLVPRFPPRARPVTLHTGDLMTTNLNIADSSIGVLNTGFIGSVDNAVGTLHSEGDVDAADAFKAFTEALVAIEEIAADQKNQLLELLSVLAAEATVPPPERRRTAMRPLLAELSTICSGVASLAALSTQYIPAIAALFA